MLGQSVGMEQQDVACTQEVDLVGREGLLEAQRAPFFGPSSLASDGNIPSGGQLTIRRSLPP